MKKLLITLALVATAVCWGDPIQISITGTADNSLMGYVAGNSYTFNYVINETSAPRSSDAFNALHNRWHEDATSDLLVFSSITGDGLDGTYVQAANPYSYLRTFNNDATDDLSLMADSGAFSMGLTANGEVVGQVTAYDLKIAQFPQHNAYSDPTAYFSPYVNVNPYTPEPGGIIRVWGVSSGSLYFTATGVTIEAIPEPSTLAFIGVFGGGIFAVRRFFLI